MATRKRSSNMKKSIRGKDARGRSVIFKAGDKVRLANGTTDTIRTCFKQTEMLAPYGRDRSFPACVLTRHSWSATGDMVRVASKSGRKVRR
jgi:hypothetical protein